MIPGAIDVLNDLNESSISEELLRVCGSERWVNKMKQQRPYSTMESILDQANSIWWGLDMSDWKIAFSAHPKIGDVKALHEKFSKSDWEGLPICLTLSYHLFSVLNSYMSFSTYKKYVVNFK